MYLNRSFLKAPSKIVVTFLGLLVLLLFLGVTTHAQSNVYTKWTSTYRPGQLPLAIVADGQGDTYVTGSVNVCFQSSTNGCQVGGTESVTIKYDSHGQTVWRASLTASPATDPNLGGSGGAHGTGLKIALDAQGNVYVLSGLFIPDVLPAVPTIATAKYNSSGVRQWVNYIASPYTPGTPMDPGATAKDTYWPTAMTVSPGGDVYTAFYHHGNTENGTDANVVKYDTNGKPQWRKPISPTPYNVNNPGALQLDANENLYVLVDSQDSANTSIHHVFSNSIPAAISSPPSAQTNSATSRVPRKSPEAMARMIYLSPFPFTLTLRVILMLGAAAAPPQVARNLALSPNSNPTAPSIGSIPSAFPTSRTAGAPPLGFPILPLMTLATFSFPRTSMSTEEVRTLMAQTSSLTSSIPPASFYGQLNTTATPMDPASTGQPPLP